MISSRQQNWVGLAFLAALLLWFYFPFLSGQQAFFFKDTTHFFEPLCRFIGDGLRSGHFPLWNPYSYCGMSEDAIPSPSIFFPLNWLFAVMPFSPALAMIMMVSQLVCAIGMFLLVQSFGWGRLPAAVAAVTVALSGYMFSLSSNYTLVATAAWLPLVLHCSRQSVVTGRFWWLLSNALAVFMMITAGRPEISAPALLLVALFGMLGEAGGEGGAVGLQRHVDFMKSLIIGILLAMPVVVPAMEWVPLSRRAQGLQPFEILLYSANWHDLLSMFILHPLDNFQLRNSPFSGIFNGVDMVPYFESAYIGIPLFALSLIGLFKPGRLLYWSTVATLVISITLALGSNVPHMNQIVGFVPGASLLRFPSKLLFFAVLSLGLLAARGAHLYLTRAVPLLPHIIGWCVVVLMSGMLFFSTRILLPFAHIDSSVAEQAQTMIAMRVGSQSAIAVFALLFLWWMSKKQKQTIALGAVALAGVGLLVLNGVISSRFGAPANYFDQPSFLLQQVQLPLGRNSSYRTTPLTFERFTTAANVDVDDRLQSTINDFQYNRQMLKGFTNIDFSLPSQFGFEGSMVGEYHNFFLNAYIASSQSVAMFKGKTIDDLPLYRLLQCGSTSHVITQITRQIGHIPQPVPPLDSELYEKIFEDNAKNVRVYKLNNPVPRAYVAASWVSIADRDELLRRMAEPAKSGFDPAKQTLVEGSIEPPAVDDVEPRELMLQSSQPERLELYVEVQVPSLVVLQDQYYPGWKVEVDGQSQPLLRCNGFMQGVSVPPGRHKVIFFYQPKSIIAGFALSLLAIAWCIALYVVGRRQTQKAEANGS